MSDIIPYLPSFCNIPGEFFGRFSEVQSAFFVPFHIFSRKILTNTEICGIIETEKIRAQSIRCLGTDEKNSSQENLSSRNLLQNPKECVIISLGCRLSGCIGVLWTLLCRAVILLIWQPAFFCISIIPQKSSIVNCFLKSFFGARPQNYR